MAKRQPSTTSLSKYARASSPSLQNRSLDFCNAFWGPGDGGVDVLFARMRGAARTMEEMRNYWKERAAIEEDYAKRLGKLAKSTLGKDEIGELRNTLDTIRLETDKQAGFHTTLASTIRSELENTAAIFHARQLQYRKTFQANIEKEFKTKQAQEAHVNKAREKYEQDCVRINSYTAQSSLVQGKDLEKIHVKLERAQQTVQANERDFANFAKAYQETVARWEQDWKAFADSCQDLEEQRMEFMKDNMWAYANAVSTVCVADDESCEKIRVALEQMEPEKDMENFVRDYGTGNQIPDPPAFVNYNTPDAIPSSSSKPMFHPANFIRTSNREPVQRQNSLPDEPETNAAVPGPSPSPSGQAARHNTTSSRSHRGPPQTQDPYAEPIGPDSEPYLKIGDNVYKVDPNKDPQQHNSLFNNTQSNLSPIKSNGNGNGVVDPLAKHMEDLKNAISSTGSTRRKSVRRSTVPDVAKPTQPQLQRQQHPTSAGGSVLSPPSATMSNLTISGSPSTSPRDYRNSAELVVGIHPSASSPAQSSRSASPNPPTAAFMKPPTASRSEVIQDVLSDYQQSLPGERKSISRSNSPVALGRRLSISGPPQQGHRINASQSGMGQQVPGQGQGGQNLARPPSMVGHPGIGAHGGSRSNSPQPPSRGPSPAPPASIKSRNSGVSSGGTGNGFMSAPQSTGPGFARAPSPNTSQAHRTSYMVPPPTTPVPPPPPPINAYIAQHQARAAALTSSTHPGYTQQAPVQAQQPMYTGYQPQTPGPGPVQATPLAMTVYQPPPPQQQQPQQVGYQQPQQTGPGLQRTPSPQPPPAGQLVAPPTGQVTEDGHGILFYVKALYDYAATIEEEFDFQAGDIIAVTHTPEDGWWSGELLDEERRQRGRHVFPSNFVCLF
ncbi:Septation protein imp2 [Termitomyces sp. J132]|nr:Septation protein imp2 [Termitomyces sp. J132]